MTHDQRGHGTARELSANWLHRYVGLTPARSPTLAPTTVVPAVAPSGMRFLEYPRVPRCVPWGCPFYDLGYRTAYRL
jgi:hypothetical protein